VIAVVRQTQQRSRWPVRRILRHLEVSPAAYYRWAKHPGGTGPAASPARASPTSLYVLLPDEREAIVAYALKHPEVRHRELAWKMLDEGVCAVSSATVYRVLREANLVCRWKPRTRVPGRGRPPAPTRPDERWQTDIRYVNVGPRNYYLLSFLDVYSRYVTHWELLRFMDGLSVSIEAAAALGTLAPEDRPPLTADFQEDESAASARACRGPVIQSDHGSGFIAREFAETLAGAEVGHRRIRPHTPTDNAEIERYQRTIGERIEEHDLEDYDQAHEVIGGIINHYNHHRLHSSLNFLRPVDYYRGNPEALLAERRRKLITARDLRKQENLKLRQRLLPYPAAQTVSYSQGRFVSL
jgi:putative transposase